jgi:hypothetical protein
MGPRLREKCPTFTALAMYRLGYEYAVILSREDRNLAGGIAGQKVSFRVCRFCFAEVGRKEHLRLRLGFSRCGSLEAQQIARSGGGSREREMSEK